MVAVSTEDEEVASVSQSYGAEVIERPKKLAGDEVSLPDVITQNFIMKIEELFQKGSFHFDGSSRYIAIAHKKLLPTEKNKLRFRC